MTKLPEIKYSKRKCFSVLSSTLCLTLRESEEKDLMEVARRQKASIESLRRSLRRKNCLRRIKEFLGI